MRAQLLADRAKAKRQLGEPRRARATLHEALPLGPADKDACKRLASIDVDLAAPASALAALDRLAEGGVAHARLHAAQALAHAQAGNIDDARRIVGFDRLHHAGTIDAPPGMDGLAALNAALAVELLGNSGLRFDRYGTPSHQSWRVDRPLVGAAPMMRLLIDRSSEPRSAMSPD